VEADRKALAIDRMRSAIDNFLGELRMAEGLKSSSYAELRDSIIELGTAWAEEDALPKLVVNYLLGLYSWIDSASYGYADEEAESIRHAARDVEELIFVHVVPAGQEDL
jgi:hypothetical protein